MAYRPEKPLEHVKLNRHPTEPLETRHPLRRAGAVNPGHGFGGPLASYRIQLAFDQRGDHLSDFINLSQATLRLATRVMLSRPYAVHAKHSGG